ncbi:MAG: leucine-rich repeat protein [Eubacteriales bacterium]
MKKFISLLLAALLLVSVLPGCGRTAGNPEESAAKDDTTTSEQFTDDIKPSSTSDFEYTVGKDGGITITKYIGTDTDAVIPEEIDGKPVTVIGTGAFKDQKTVTTVTLPDTVVDLEDEAFFRCGSLTSINLPGQLKTIGSHCFFQCGLKSISIPGTVQTIGNSAFFECKLESIELNEGLVTIGDTAFTYADITRITIPNSVQSIGGSSFHGCEKLETVTLGSGLRTIGQSAFFFNKSLKEIVIPASVTFIGMYAFEACDVLEAVRFEGNAPDFEIGITTYENYTVYYHEGAEGFTSPVWNGHPTEIW